MMHNQLNDLGLISITIRNFKFFSFLESEGMKTNNFLINDAAKIGNIFVVKYFLEKNQDILFSSSESVNI